MFIGLTYTTRGVDLGEQKSSSSRSEKMQISLIWVDMEFSGTRAGAQDNISNGRKMAGVGRIVAGGNS